MGSKSDLSIREVAELKDVHPNTVRAAIRRDPPDLPAVRSERGWRIERIDARKWEPNAPGRPVGGGLPAWQRPRHVVFFRLNDAQLAGLLAHSTIAGESPPAVALRLLSPYLTNA